MRPLLRHGCLGTVTAVLVLLLSLIAAGCTDLDGGTAPSETNTAASATTAGPTTSGAAETTTTAAAPSTTAVTEAPTTTSATAGPPSSTVTTIALASSEETIDNGNITATCRIELAFEYGMRSITVNYVDFLTGEEARQAAIAAGDLAPGEDLPNDYYISDTNPKLRDYDVSDSVVITTTSRSGGPDEPATWAEFVMFFSPNPPQGAEHLKDMPWLIERRPDTNVVVRIDEIYIP